MSLDRAAIPDWALPSRILDPDLEPEAPWARRLREGDETGAASAYVAALRTAPPLLDLEQSYVHVWERFYGGRMGFEGGHQLDPDQVIRKHYVGVYGIAHTFTGEIDWMYDPTADWGEARTREWQVQFNRHYQWVPLARQWAATGDVRYARHWEYELTSWVESQCPGPKRKDMRLPGTWRTIDAGIRGGWTWPIALEHFRGCEAVSDRALWLCVAAYREHGRYLFYSPTGCNFKTMENISLLHAGLLLPGLRDSRVWASTALDRTIAELERQFYDDGTQVELAPTYGALAAGCSYATLLLAQAKGLAEPRDTRIPARVWLRLAQVLAVYGDFAMPDGSVPGLHDDNRMNCATICAEARRVPVVGATLPATARWQAGDGVDHLDWAGYGVLRREGRWSFLDAGPWGAGHQHADALQVLTWADGGIWLHDPGKPLYDQTDFTRHMRGAPGHNVVLLNGRPHLPDPQRAQTNAPFPMAVLSTDGLSLSAARRAARQDDGAAFTHERLLLDIAGVGWLVLDRLQTAAPVTTGWEWLWHFPETVQLSLDAERIRADRADGRRLWLSHAADTPLQPAPLRGQETPQRGWTVDNKTRERIPLPVARLSGGAGRGRVTCATLLSAAPRALHWLAPDTLDLEGRRYRFLGESQISGLEHPGGHLSIPPHDLPAGT